MPLAGVDKSEKNRPLGMNRNAEIDIYHSLIKMCHKIGCLKDFPYICGVFIDIS